MAAESISEDSVFEESDDSDDDGSECCSTNDSWQGELPAKSYTNLP